MADLAAGLYTAREAQAKLLTQIEGESSHQGQQTFLEVTSRIAQERRLSRFLYVAEKPARI